LVGFEHTLKEYLTIKDILILLTQNITFALGFEIGELIIIQ